MKQVIALFFVFTLCFSNITEAGTQTSITINIPSMTLELYSDGFMIKEYPIAIGKAWTQTPVGNYQVVFKEKDPTWYPPEKNGYGAVGPGPNNPLGSRWIGIGGNYGIHSTNNPDSVGTAASNGCIRMHEEDVEDVYEKIDVGTPVNIVYERLRIIPMRDGKTLIKFSEDVYEKQEFTDEMVLQELAKSGIASEITEDEKNKIFNQEDVYLSPTFSITFPTKISSRIYRKQDTNYIKIKDLSHGLGFQYSFSWDTKIVKTQKGELPVKIIGNEPCVSLSEAEILFPVKFSVNESAKLVSLVLMEPNVAQNNKSQKT